MFENKKVDLASLTPMQIANSYNQVKFAAERSPGDKAYHIANDGHLAVIAAVVQQCIDEKQRLEDTSVPKTLER